MLSNSQSLVDRDQAMHVVDLGLAIVAYRPTSLLWKARHDGKELTFVVRLMKNKAQPV